MATKIYRVRNTIDSIDTARMLGHAIVSTHAGVSVHIHEVENIFGWEGKVSQIIEYELSILCTHPDRIDKVIKNYSYYQIPELIIDEISVKPDIEKWVTNWCKDYVEIKD